MMLGSVLSNRKVPFQGTEVINIVYRLINIVYRQKV